MTLIVNYEYYSLCLHQQCCHGVVSQPCMYLTHTAELVSSFTASPNDHYLSPQIHSEIACEVRDLVARGSRPPNLTVVLVGDDPASHSYVSSKQKAAKSVGMAGEVLLKPDTISQVRLHDNYLLKHCLC